MGQNRRKKGTLKPIEVQTVNNIENEGLIELTESQKETVNKIKSLQQEAQNQYALLGSIRSNMIIAEDKAVQLTEEIYKLDESLTKELQAQHGQVRLISDTHIQKV